MCYSVVLVNNVLFVTVWY